MVRLHLGHGLSIRAAARALGLPTATAWRRFWWVMDVWTIPTAHGRAAEPLRTPQRGTRACPTGPPPRTRPDPKPRAPRTSTGIPLCPGCAAVLWTTGAIGRRLGVGAERARQLSHRPDFPAPAAVEGLTRLWCSTDIVSWQRRHRQPRDQCGRFRERTP